MPKKFWPVVGTVYLIKEWDGSKFKVKVLETSAADDSVKFEYIDTALRHDVSADYFVYELEAMGVYA